MNRFNLTFSGEIVTGQEPEEVKQRFGKMFAIDDPVRLERFFCGETIILRRDLERKEAAHYFQEMRKLGAVGELVKVTASQAMNSVGSPPSPVHTTSPAAPGKQIEIAFAPKTPPPETDKADRAPATEPAPNPDPDPATASSGKNTKNQSAKTGKPRRQKKKVARPQRGLTPQQRKSAKKTAQHQARSVKAGREATEETERRQALLEEAVRKAGEAVRHKEHQREARLNAAEETAGQEAPGEETEAKAIEEDARQEPQREEARARSAEEVAREEAEAKAAEEVARKKAQREEAKRKAAEKAARQKAQREEAKRKTAEKAARQKAQREEAKRKTAEEAERRKAAEEAARQQALREEAERRKAAEEAARQQALREEAERRKAAEEAARQQALREEAERKAAEEAARLQAELEEQRRREIEENARLEAELAEIERQEEEQAARLRAELEEKAREAAAEAARIKAVAEQKRQDAKSKSLARRRGTPHTKSTKSKQREKEKQQVAPQATKNKSEPVADKSKQVQDSARQQQESTPPAKAGPGHALQDTAAAGLTETSTPQPALKPLKGRVKTNLEVPQRITGQAAATQVKRKRQPGEPNLYQLRAFRNTQEVRGRAELAKRRMGQAFILGALALAGLLILGGSFLRRAPLLPVAGAEFIAINLQSGPVMLAAGQLLLHDRAGIGTEQVAVDTLGVSSLQAPMAFDGNGNLLAIGKLQDNNEPPAKEGLQLLRCDLTLRKCQQFSPQLAGTDIGALAINTIDNSLLLADRLTKELLKLDDQGEILLRAEIPMAEQPTLRLHSGLLFMNSTQGPAISVFRYDDKAFGQQLDEVLLLPPAAAELEQTRTGDFVWSGNAWWVSLLNPISGSVGLYRFSADWSYLDQVELSRGPGALRLNAWGEKTLVNDQQSIEVQRFNAQGGAEVPLVSGLLKDLVDGQRRRANSTALAWRTGLLLCAVLAAAGLCLGYLQRLRVLVYKSYRERGADPVDDHVESLQWIDPVDNRRGRLRRRGFSYALLSIALVLMGIGNSVSALQLAALFIVLSGPAVALVLWSRRPVGHIGILGQGLLLVDPRGIYHMGEGSQVHYRGSFLLIDDIVVFTGNRLLPAFSPQQVQGLVKPIAAGGIRVDFNTVLVKLLQSQHPLAQGVIAILATATTALVLLGLQGIF